MDVEISNKLFLTGIPEGLQADIKKQLTLSNPKYQDNLRMNRFNGTTPAELHFYENVPGKMIIPRGFVHCLYRMSCQCSEPVKFIDHRRELKPADFDFQATLKPFQMEAVKKMLTRESGVLVAATGAGKTVMALALIAERQQPALIIVHTKELLNQWVDRIETFLGIPREEVGLIGNGKRIVGKQITVGMVQTLCKCAEDLVPYIGHIIVDECHRTPSKTFSDVLTTFDCKFILGLTATPWRRDKLHKLIFFTLGDVIHEVDKKHLLDTGAVLRAHVTWRETDFSTRLDAAANYSKMMSELCKDGQRNRLICSDVAKEAEAAAGIVLVLSDRKNHCHTLQGILKDKHGIDAAVLTGGLGKKARQEITEGLHRGEIKVLIATGQLIGEGFDCPALESLFLATPLKFAGRVLQYLGRVLRPAPGKTEGRVFDYVDSRVGVLKASAKARARVYQAAA